MKEEKILNRMLRLKIQKKEEAEVMIKFYEYGAPGIGKMNENLKVKNKKS